MIPLRYGMFRSSVRLLDVLLAVVSCRRHRHHLLLLAPPIGPDMQWLPSSVRRLLSVVRPVVISRKLGKIDP